MKVYVANGDGSLSQVCVTANEGHAQLIAQMWKMYYSFDRVFFGDDELSCQEIGITETPSGLRITSPLTAKEKKHSTN
jgi:hypothetical protein